MDDHEMTLLLNLYDLMDDTEKANWSMDAAAELIADQHTYERQHNQSVGTYHAQFWYDTILELIQEDEVSK